MFPFDHVARLYMIVPRERFALLSERLMERFALKDQDRAALAVADPDEWLPWLLGMMGWQADLLPGGKLQITHYSGNSLSIDADPFLECAAGCVEDGCYVEGYSQGNLQWQLLYSEDSMGKHTKGEAFPHHHVPLPNGRLCDIATEPVFWQAVEELACSYLLLPSQQRKRVLRGVVEDADLPRQIGVAVASDIGPKAVHEYAALLQIVDALWDTFYAPTDADEDDEPTPAHTFDIALRESIVAHIESRWDHLVARSQASPDDSALEGRGRGAGGAPERGTASSLE